MIGSHLRQHPRWSGTDLIPVTQYTNHELIRVEQGVQYLLGTRIHDAVQNQLPQRHHSSGAQHGLQEMARDQQWRDVL